MLRRPRTVPVTLAALALGAAGAASLVAQTVRAQDAPTYSADACILSALAATPAAAAGTPEIRDVVAGRPAWLTTGLTDVCSGAAFDLAQIAGKTVFVHPMATW